MALDPEMQRRVVEFLGEGSLRVLPVEFKPTVKQEQRWQKREKAASN